MIFQFCFSESEVSPNPVPPGLRRSRIINAAGGRITKHLPVLLLLVGVGIGDYDGWVCVDFGDNGAGDIGVGAGVCGFW